MTSSLDRRMRECFGSDSDDEDDDDEVVRTVQRATAENLPMGRQERVWQAESDHGPVAPAQGVRECGTTEVASPPLGQ